LKEEDMELMERYLQEIGSYLPKDLRQEVADELRTNLEETLEKRLATGEGELREDVEIAFLRELGPPHQLADSYVPKPRVLFGPRLYPAFIRTMKIAIAVLVALSALGVFVDFTQSASPLLSLGRSLIEAFSTVLTGSLMVLGVAVVVFAIVERTAAAPPEAVEEWDPLTLADVEDQDKAALGDQVASIAFLVVALLVLNLFRDRIGAYVTMNEERGWIPMLGPAFDAQLWLLNLCLVLDLLVNFLVLLRWRWSTLLRWAKFGVNVCYLVWLGRLVFGPSILEVDPQWMIDHGWSAEKATEYEELTSGLLSRIIAINLKLAFLAACMGLAYSLFKLVRRMFEKS